MDLTLAKLGAGALEEKFQKELARLVENLHDPNTDPGVKRELKIMLTFHPNKEDRGVCDLTTAVTSKLAASKSLDSVFYSGIDTDTGEIGAQERVFDQPSLFEAPEPSGKPVGKVRSIQDG